MDTSDARWVPSSLWLGAALSFLLLFLFPLRSWAQNAGRADAVKLKASLPGAGAAPDGLPATSSPDRLTVLVFDYAGIPAKVRSRAEQEAAYILGRSGPEAHFVDCLTGPEASGNPAACRPPFDPAALYVRIVAQRPARGLPAETLGFAALETGSGGQYAGIFYRSAADAASRLQADVYLMLGCVLAHEIGHMLLGPRSHSPDGIMRARWTREDLLRAGQRSLRFTPEQSARVRSAVEARNNPHPPPTDSALSLAQSDRPTRGPEKIPLLRFDQHPFNPLCSDSAATSLQRSLMGRPVNAYAPTADSVLCAAY